MQERREKVAMWPGYVTSALVLVMGLVTDNVLSAAVHGTVAASLFPIACGLAVGSLTVLTFVRRGAAFLVAASLYSALTVIALLLPLALVTHVLVLSLGLVTTLACLFTPLIVPVVGQPAPVQVPVETDERRR